MTYLETDRTAQRREVIARELAWHEEEAEKRYGLDSFLYAPPAFDRVVARMLAFLEEDTAVPAALDLACGEGKETLAMAQRGWTVFSLDLSYAQLARVRKLVQKTDPTLPVHFIQANAEQLPFARNSFPVVYGKAIIHHLDLELSAAQVNRVLQARGRAAVAEPLAHHPLFWLGRRLTPKLRTADERPLTYAAFQAFRRKFAHGTMTEDFLLAPLAYLFRLLPGGEALFPSVHAALARLDRRLLRHLPFLKPLAWYGTLFLQKGQNHES